MSWLYVPGMEGSPSDCQANQDIGLWVVLSGTPTQRPLSWRGWKARNWIKLLCGTISKPSTADRGAARWISSLPDSPANPSPPPASDRGLRMLAGSGRRSLGSWVRFDPDGSCWRTFHKSSSTASPMSSTTLPRSGSMRNGVCSPRQPLEPHTSVNDSGSSGAWSTPMARDIKGQGFDNTNLPNRASMWATPVAKDTGRSIEAHLEAKANHKGGPRTEPTSLTVQSKMWAETGLWPTPIAGDAKGNGNSTKAFEQGWNGTLTDRAVRMWGTPRASDASRGSDPVRTNAKAGAPTLKSQTIAFPHDPTTATGGSDGKVLNPRFVEALMGLPNGWLTPSISAATGSSRNAPEPPGVSWLRALLNLPTTTDDD